MSSPDLDVRHVARLARIALAEEEVTTFQEQLGRVLEHIEHLRNSTSRASSRPHTPIRSST